MSPKTTVKSIQDIMRQDTGVDGDAQRLSQLCWMFFLKIIDEFTYDHSERLGDAPAEHGGVSDFGAQVIRRMNELGMMVDISHASKATALEAMRLLEDFEPRLVGPLLSGTATAHNDIALHLFADTPETVAVRLMDCGIPHEVAERRFRGQRDVVQAFPALRFTAGGHGVDATIFPKDGIRQAPPGPVDGRPMRRATLAEVEALMEGSDPLISELESRPRL